MLVRVRVKAGARKEKFVELMEYSFDIHVKEKAERHAANNRVRTLLAHYFHVPLSAVTVVSGHHGPKKTIRVIK